MSLTQPLVHFDSHLEGGPKPCPPHPPIHHCGVLTSPSSGNLSSCIFRHLSLKVHIATLPGIISADVWRNYKTVTAMNEHRNQNVDWRYADVAKMAVLVPTARGENLYLCSTRTLTPPQPSSWRLAGTWIVTFRCTAYPPVVFNDVYDPDVSRDWGFFAVDWGGRQLADEW